MADVTLGLVIECIKHLILLGVVIMVPVFQYSNVYRPTPKLSQLAKCKTMQKRCIQQCSKYSSLVSPSHSPHSKAKIRDVFRIFASMAHGATFGELCVRFNPAALNINEKQMVLFGLLEGLIRRVDKYPITVSRNLFYDDEPIHATDIRNPDVYLINVSSHMNSGSRPLPRGELQGKSHNNHQNDVNSFYLNQLRHRNGSISSKHQFQHQSSSSAGPHIYNGLKSFDEICTKRGISCQQLEAQLAKDRHVIVLLK